MGGAKLTTVLFVSSPGLGVTYHLANLACELTRKGVDVRAVASPGEQIPGLRERLRRSGVELHTIRGLESLDLSSLPASTSALARVLKDSGAQIVHAWGLRHFVKARLALKPGSRRGTRIVVCIPSMHHGSRLWRMWYVLGALILRRADLVVLHCYDEYRKMVRHGLPRAKARIVHNWIHLQDWEAPVALKALPGVNLSSGAVTCAYLAQFSPRKGHRYLLRAAALVRKRGHDLHLLLGGGLGRSVDDLKTMARALGIAESTHFLGYVDNRQVPSLIRSCDLVAIPSLAETFGVSIIEPLIVGKPLVTTRVGVAHELEAAGGAIVVPPGDERALADGILDVMENRTGVQERARRGRRFVLRRCTTGTVAEQFAAIYSGLSKTECAGTRKKRGCRA